MKNLIALIAIALVVLVSSCGDSKVITVPVQVEKGTPGAIATEDSTDYFVMKDIKFETYGFINRSDYHNDMIEYDWTGGNLFWSIVLSETIVTPILIIGLDWYEPVGIKDKYRSSTVKIIEK